MPPTLKAASPRIQDWRKQPGFGILGLQSLVMVQIKVVPTFCFCWLRDRFHAIQNWQHLWTKWQYYWRPPVLYWYHVVLILANKFLQWQMMPCFCYIFSLL